MEYEIIYHIRGVNTESSNLCMTIVAPMTLQRAMHKASQHIGMYSVKLKLKLKLKLNKALDENSTRP